MIDLIPFAEKLIQDTGNELAKQGVKLAKENAPKDTRKLADSIDSHHPGKYVWYVDTHASGWNGVQYPARIENGDPVLPRRKGYVWFHGKAHLFASASEQSGFMEKTIGMLHI